MSVTLHCIRHGQGLHNVGAGNYQLPDPKLTELGEAQCVALRESHFPDQSRISLIASSPLSRALHSASLIFESVLRSATGPRAILALPDAQETSTDPCDIGSNLDTLNATCWKNQWPVDLSMVKCNWNVKEPGTRYSPSSKAIRNRARNLRMFLRQQARVLLADGEKDVHIALVAHGGFMHYLTEDWEGADRFPATGWHNCETRTYTFAQGVMSDDGDAWLDECMDGRRARGLTHAMVPCEMQGRLYQHAMRAWEAQGLQNHDNIDDGVL